MKRIKKVSLILMAVIMAMLSSFASIAGQEAREITNYQTLRTDHSVEFVGSPRGRLVSVVTSILTDEGRGTIGVAASMMCHVPVEKIRMAIRLEHWDEEVEAWEVVDTQNITWLKEEFPINGLTEAMVYYEVPNQQRGQYYRLRGVAVANEIGSDLIEAWSLATEELYVE